VTYKVVQEGTHFFAIVTLDSGFKVRSTECPSFQDAERIGQAMTGGR
jgi:hypothetical protein